MENLCHLACWLYVYGRPDAALECISLTKNVPFDQNYNVWTFIHAMWGLEIRILREIGEFGKAGVIAGLMDEHMLMPNKILDTPEKMEKHEEKRRARFGIGPEWNAGIEVSYLDKVESADSLARANAWRFVALLKLIGATETGLYPNLNSKRDIVEKVIAEYIGVLSRLK